MNNCILIIDCGSTKVPLFETILSGFGQDCKITSLSNLDKEQLQDYCGIIISGAPILVTEIDTQPYLSAFAFLNNYSNSILIIDLVINNCGKLVENCN